MRKPLAVLAVVLAVGVAICLTRRTPRTVPARANRSRTVGILAISGYLLAVVGILAPSALAALAAWGADVGPPAGGEITVVLAPRSDTEAAIMREPGTRYRTEIIMDSVSSARGDEIQIAVVATLDGSLNSDTREGPRLRGMAGYVPLNEVRVWAAVENWTVSALEK
jgi:hypothetical protein